jgi:hypothetical protein
VDDARELRDGHGNWIKEDAGLVGIGTEPSFAIGQRALLVPWRGSWLLPLPYFTSKAVTPSFARSALETFSAAARLFTGGVLATPAAGKTNAAASIP